MKISLVLLLQSILITALFSAVISCDSIPNPNRNSPEPNESNPREPDSDEPIPEDGPVEQTAVNLVELTITAAPAEFTYIPGHLTKVWAYNGQIPGPEIHAEVGDTVIVHFINNLPEPSTLHWHGLELPANMDGSHISQTPVPAGESFTYKFKVNRAATYWYHSHFKTNEQVEKGLYGAFVVHDSKEDQLLNLPLNEKVLMLDDVLLDEEMQIMPPFPKDPVERATTQANGRIGNTLIINGRVKPVFEIEDGKPIRLRLINSSNSRFFRLSLPAPHKMYRVGGDTGVISKSKVILPISEITDEFNPYQKKSDPDLSKGLLIVPGERADVVIHPGETSDSSFVMELHDTKRGMHIGHMTPSGVIELIPDPADGMAPSIPLMQFNLNRSAESDTDILDEFQKKSGKLLRSQKFLKLADVTNPQPLKVSFGHGNPDQDGNIMFFAKAEMKNGKMTPYPYMKLTNELALQAKIGEIRVLEVTNFAAGIHPFHIHGFPFQLIETQYIDMEHPERNRIVKVSDADREWKDTIPVPGRPGYRMKSRAIMRLLVNFSDQNRAGELEAHGGHAIDDRSGGWFVHCHIMEHARLGMATWINLFK